jgi:LuxR family maltose regulon positive regulatory protein
VSTPILATKLYIPPPRSKVVLRPRLIERLNEGLRQNQGFGRKLTLISAPAGFGKTTLVSEWVHLRDEVRRMKDEGGSPPIHPSAFIPHPSRVAWLSLDEGDNDPARFLTYLVAALQTLAADMGTGVVAALQSPQPPPTEWLLTTLLNDIATIPDDFILVLDDYHTIDSKPVDDALAFLLGHLPPQMHVVIATREDPQLPLARLRARGQLSELRAADLRFTPSEAADFLNHVMDLNLSAEDIVALETRTEGWIAGLQLAALALQGTLSMQGHPDTASFIKSFTGSHHFVLDYLVEEVLEQQPESVQAFLLRTSILDRLCGPLCDAMLGKDEGGGPALSEVEGMKDEEDSSAFSPSLRSGQALQSSSFILEYLEHANLFIIPLDNERCWYRYHHLFGDLLRQRLGQSLTPGEIAELHVRASEWYENNGLAFEAFRHATAAKDVERAERLIGSKKMGLHFRSVATTVLDWLASLPRTVLDARPWLWVRSATLALMAGQTTGVEEKLQAAEAVFAAQTALQDAEPDDKTRDLIGQIACARATLALTRYDPEAMIIQARRALEYLHPDNLTFRFTASWALASAYIFQGDRAAAAQSCLEGIAISQKSGDIFSTILATSNLGEVQELENQLYLAAESYRQVLQLSGDHPQPNAGDIHLGLARIQYEWNDLEAAEQHGEQSLQLLRQYDSVIDRFILAEVFLARLKLAQGDSSAADAMLAQSEQSARQPHFTHRAPEVAAVRVLVLLQQNKLEAAIQLAQAHPLPLSQARVLLAQGNPSAALAILEPLRQQMEAKGWQDERLKVMALQVVALNANGEKDKAVQVLGEVLAQAEPGGFIRLFVDEGEPMRLLILDFRLWIEKQSRAQDQKLVSYIDRLLAAFPRPAAMPQSPANHADIIGNQKSLMFEPLSPRELEILRLIAQGLSNHEIGERLFLALDTVKGHNRRIFDKLQVQRRTEAIARARELGLL